MSNILAPAPYAGNQTYNGPLPDYHYQNSEIGNLLDFLQQIKRSYRVWLIDNLDYGTKFPKSGFDIYVVGCFGEAARYDFLKQLNDCYSNKKIICLTPQAVNLQGLDNIKVYNIEHLHTLINFFPKTNTTDLAQRDYLHSILTRRLELHRILFTALLLNSHQKVLYSMVKLPGAEYSNPKADWMTKFLPDEFVQSINNKFGYLCNTAIANKIKELLTETRVVEGTQWDIANGAYQNTIVHWVNETIFMTEDLSPTAYITEKTIKPIVSRTPFVVLGQINTYQRLKRLGFRIYDNVFNIDFDHGTESDRIEKIHKLIVQLDQTTVNSNLDKLQSDADWNYEYFYKGFAEHCKSLNSIVINEIIEYINE